MEAIKHPNLIELDEVRKKGYKPSVVICLINNEKTFMLHSKEFNMWVFLQGGIKNNEEISECIKRKLNEELNLGFSELTTEHYALIGMQEITFAQNRQGKEVLTTDTGEKIHMKGKHYYFAVLNLGFDEINVANTEYDHVFLVDATQAKFLGEKIYQAGKREMTLKCIELLAKGELIK